MKKILLIGILCSPLAWLPAQTDTASSLLDLAGGLEDEKPLTIATFKGTRLINLHTVEVPGRRTLEFRIAHRFGAFNSGWYDFFGLDGGASIRLGLEYSHDGRFQVGLGRTSVEKTLDGFAKYRLIRQYDRGGAPLSVTLFGSAFYTLLEDPNAAITGVDRYAKASARYSYASQVIVGRKFSERLSLQVSPTYIHLNQTEVATDKNDIFVVGFAGRYKFTKRSAVTVEYGWRPSTNYSQNTYFNTFSLGLEVETGGHVFQTFVSNSIGLTEPQFLSRTDTEWRDMGIRLGFNISRVFTVGGEPKEKNW